MRVILSWIWAISLMLVIGLSFVALSNWIFGQQVPLWMGVYWAAVILVGIPLVRHIERKGWIRGVFRDPQRSMEYRERKRQLELDRERVIAEFEARTRKG
jgi:hypothetical protein